LLPKLLTPAQSLDLAYRRQKPTRAQLADFAAARAELLQPTSPTVVPPAAVKKLLTGPARPGKKSKPTQ